MKNHEEYVRVGIIMAGGSGERFWPLSRRNRPKQLLRLASASKSMIEEAVERLAPIIAPQHIYIVTGEHLVDIIRDAEIGVAARNVLAEPSKRNTGGCLSYAAAYMLDAYRDSKVSMAVTTADHVIGDGDRFRETVLAALEAAEEHGVLATHGIVPTRPETGYGYIQAQEDEGPLEERHGIQVFPVAAFHEKPNKEKARDFIDTGSYYWNSGMFFWTLDTFLREMADARPKMAETIHNMAAAMEHNDKGSVKRIFETLEDISIDYALMEHSRKVVVARADYAWDDVGAWTSLDRTREKDAEGNVTQGDPVLIDSTNCIVYNEPGADAMAVSVVGARDLVVVVSKDGVLVVPKEHAQDVRDAVSELKARGSKHV